MLRPSGRMKTDTMTKDAPTTENEAELEVDRSAGADPLFDAGGCMAFADAEPAGTVYEGRKRARRMEGTLRLAVRPSIHL